MAISVASIGTNANIAGATVAASVGAGGVPSASTIVVVVAERTAGASIGTISDTAGNTYTAITSAQLNANNGISGVFYAKNASALVNGGSITYTKITNGTDAAISAIYATGINTSAPLDTAVTASATGTGTSPSVTSGTPSVGGELFIGVVASQGIASFTEDTGHGWASPPVNVQSGSSTSDRAVAGGNQVNAGTGTKIFAPTLGTAVDWAAYIVGLKPVTSIYILTTAAGSYAITGAGPRIGRAFTAMTTAGAYAVTGAAVTMKRALKIIAAPGSYALAGSSPLLKNARHMATVVGVYAVIGVSPILKNARRMATTVGTYAITGATFISAYLPAAASKFLRRRAPPTLQRLRQVPPTLED